MKKTLALLTLLGLFAAACSSDDNTNTDGGSAGNGGSAGSAGAAGSAGNAGAAGNDAGSDAGTDAGLDGGSSEEEILNAFCQAAVDLEPICVVGFEDMASCKTVMGSVDEACGTAIVEYYECLTDELTGTDCTDAKVACANKETAVEGACPQ